MRHLTITVALSLAAPLAAQFSCVGTVAPWVHLTCPCPSSVTPFIGAPFYIWHEGTGRIGSLQRVYFTPGSWGYAIPAQPLIATGLLAVGFPSASPTPLPPALMVCRDMSSVPSLSIDPIAVLAQAAGWPIPNQLNYYLFIPASPNLVGLTVVWQGFAIAAGSWNQPIYPSQLLGLTIQP